MIPGTEFVHEVIPAILEKEWSEIEKKLNLLKGHALTVHIDFIDGKFADNTTHLDPTPFAKYKHDFLLEAHLMVEDPLSYVQPLSKNGFRRFIGHIERMPDQAAFVADTQLLGEVGLAIDGSTTLDKITVPYDDLDTILVMMIKAGFAGQKFNEENLEKIKELKAKTDIPLEVDGGINEQTLVKIKKAGALRCAVNSAIFKDPSPTEMFSHLSTTFKR